MKREPSLGVVCSCGKGRMQEGPETGWAGGPFCSPQDKKAPTIPLVRAVTQGLVPRACGLAWIAATRQTLAPVTIRLGWFARTSEVALGVQGNRVQGADGNPSPK